MNQRRNWGNSTASQIFYEAQTGLSDVWKGLTGIAQGSLGVAKLVDMTAMGTGVAVIEGAAFIPAMGIAMVTPKTVPQVLKEVASFANNPVASRAVGYAALAAGAGFLWAAPSFAGAPPLP